MDKVFLHDLRVDTVIGIWDWERRVRQNVRIDLEMEADVGRAAAADSIDVALNYQAVADQVAAHVRDSSYALVESLAEAVARIVVVDFAVPWVRVTLAKPGAVEGAGEVGVVIERRSASYA